MNEEYLDIITPDNKQTGHTATRSEIHAKGLWHKTAHVWIVRKHNNRMQILLQKRAMMKDSFPNKYDISSAGHVKAGTTPRDSAVRELKEELGLYIEPHDLKYIGQFVHNFDGTFYDKPFIDNEYTYVYVYHKDIDINGLKLQTEEVNSVKWFDIRTIKNSIESNNSDICISKTAFNIILQHIKYMNTNKKGEL